MATKYSAQSNAARSAYRATKSSGGSTASAQSAAKSVMSKPPEASGTAYGKSTKTSTPKTSSNTVGGVSSNIQTRDLTTKPANITTPENVIDYKAELEALKNARLQSTMAGLEGKLNQARAGIQERRELLPAEQRELKRQVSVQSKLGAKSFNEFLAQRGLARSGEAGQARLMQNMALQGELGAIGRQGQQEMAGLARQERGLQQQYASDVAQAQAGIEQDYITQLLAQRQREQDISRADAIRQQDLALKDRYRTEDIALRDRYRTEDLGLAEQQRTEEKNRYRNQMRMLMEDRSLSAEDRALRLQELERKQFESEVTGLGGQMDYQQAINDVSNDGDPSNDWKIPILQRERASKLESMSTARATEEANAIKQAEQMMDRLGYATEPYASILGVPEGTTTLEYQKMKNTDSREWARIQAAKDKAAKEGSQGKEDKRKFSDLVTAKKYLDSIFFEPEQLDSDRNVVKESYLDKEGLKTHLRDLYLSGEIDETMFKNLASAYLSKSKKDPVAESYNSLGLYKTFD